MRIRINNIECRFSQGRYEIVKWQRNLYYGKLQEYLESGYNLVDGFVSNTNHRIQASIFDSPESCYTVATLHYDSDEGCCDMKTVGPRLLDLDKTERNDFFAVYEYAEDRIREEELNRIEEPEF
jgi:hypothetical protein